MCQAMRGHADLGAGCRHVSRTSPGARSLREKRAAFSPKGCHQLHDAACQCCAFVKIYCPTFCCIQET